MVVLTIIYTRLYLITYHTIPLRTFAAIDSALRGRLDGSNESLKSVSSKSWLILVGQIKALLYKYSVIQTLTGIRATYVQPIAKHRHLIKHEPRSNFARQIAAAYWHIHSTSRVDAARCCNHRRTSDNCPKWNVTIGLLIAYTVVQGSPHVQGFIL